MVYPMPQKNTIVERVIGRAFILFSFKTDVWKKNMSLNGENCKVEAWQCNKQCHACSSCRIAVETMLRSRGHLPMSAMCEHKWFGGRMQ